MLEKLKQIAKDFKQEIKVWKLVLKDPRTTKLAKILLGLAVVYALLPFDLIPDLIPGIGYLDDIILITIIMLIALKMIPKEVVEDCRIRATCER